MNPTTLFDGIRKTTDVDQFLRLDREIAGILAGDSAPATSDSPVSDGCLAEPPAVELERVDFKIFNDGRIQLDGGMLYASAPRLVWNNWTTTNRSHRMVVGLNGLAIKSGDQLIIVNPGAGTLDIDYQKSVLSHTGMNRVRFAVGELMGSKGLRQITDVFLTDLRFASCGAVGWLDRLGAVGPFFPKARVTAPAEGLDFARSGGHPRMSYGPPDLPHLEFITPTYEPAGEPLRIAPAVHRVPVPACGPGAAIVVINTPAQRVAYLGQFALTPEHLLYGITTAWDVDPVGVLKARARALEWLVDGWLIVFQHDRKQSLGYLVNRHGTIRFDPIKADKS